MTITISAHIPDDLAQKLEKVAEFERRSKSYYIKEGLAEIFEQKFYDMQHLISAKKTLREAKSKGEFVSFEEVFKGIR